MKASLRRPPANGANTERAIRLVRRGTKPTRCPACRATLYRVHDRHGIETLVECSGPGLQPPSETTSGLGRPHRACSWSLFDPSDSHTAAK